jgi:hypothetical protein
MPSRSPLEKQIAKIEFWNGGVTAIGRFLPIASTKRDAI